MPLMNIGASNKTTGAWNQIEREIGTSRGVDGEEVHHLPSGDQLGTGSEEINRVRQIHEARSAGIGEERAGRRPDSERVAAAGTRRRVGSPKVPIDIYDPFRGRIPEAGEEEEPEVEEQEAEEPEALDDMNRPVQRVRKPGRSRIDPADAEFFGLGEPQQRSADTEVERMRIENQRERERMTGSLALFQHSPALGIQAMDLDPNFVVEDLRRRGLLRDDPQPRRGARVEEEDEHEYGLDDDRELAPAAKRLIARNRRLESELRSIRDDLGRVAGVVEQDRRKNAQREQIRARAAALSGVKGFLAERAMKTPALNNELGRLMVDNVVLRLSGQIDQLPSEASEINKIGLEMLQKAAITSSLNPSRRAAVAARSIRRESGPIPTRAGRTVPVEPEARSTSRTRRINFSDDGQRRSASLAWLADRRRRLQAALEE